MQVLLGCNGEGTGSCEPLFASNSVNSVVLGGVMPGPSQGIEGMRVGGVRTFSVTPSLGFGGQTTVGPLGVIPGDSTLTYEVRMRNSLYGGRVCLCLLLRRNCLNSLSNRSVPKVNAP